MRILLTTDTVGGVWTFTKELSTGLLRRGHTVALVSFGRVPSSEQVGWVDAHKNEYQDSFRCKSSAAPLEWMRANKGAYRNSSQNLLRIVDEFRPDVLHTSQFCFGRLPVPVPKVVTAHSDVLSWASACRPDGLEDSAWLTEYSDLVQRGLAGADAVVAPTRWMLGALREHFDLPAVQHVIFNGRELPGLSEKEAHRVQAVSVGRVWDEAKNIALLTMVDSPMMILVAGEEEHDGVCAPAATGSVTLTGSLTEVELLSVLSESSIYIAPSIYEPFGLALVEAALCGCAIVANDLASFREVWGDAALYFGDAASLGLLLRHLQGSPEALKRAQRSAMQRALQLTGDRMTEAYLSVYADLLAGAARGSRPVEDLVTDGR